MLIDSEQQLELATVSGRRIFFGAIGIEKDRRRAAPTKDRTITTRYGMVSAESTPTLSEESF